MIEIPERAFATEVVEQLRAAGFEALWAGGCVRDFLLGQEPVDYDVATSATPEQVRELFGHQRTLSVGISFGVVVVLPKQRREAQQIEVATFRTDGGYSDGRHPDAVVFSTPEHDAQRRDFTINGMFYDPVERQVIDYVGGQEDLRAGIIRAIGDPAARIAEDKLRMLRAVRFAARFGFEMDAATSAAVAASAPEVSLVSAERIAVELQKTLATPRASWAVEQWSSLGLLVSILPEIDAEWSRVGPLARRLLEELREESWQVKLAALLFAASPAERSTVPGGGPAELVASLKRRLKLSNAYGDELRFILENQPILQHAHQRRFSELQPILAHEHTPSAVRLLAATVAATLATGLDDGLPAAGSEHLIEPGNQLRQALQAVRSWLELPPHELDPPPLLVGADLIEAGLPPGPNFKAILEEARARQLDGLLHDSAAALHWLKSKGDA